MNTRLVAPLSALALGALVGANGCADNRASIQIDAICLPTDDCMFSDKCDAQYIGYPTLDTAASARDALWLVLQLSNQLTNNADEATGRGNTHDAHVDETVIEYEGVALPIATVGSNFDVPAGGTAVISAEVIPDAINAETALAALAPSAEPREIVATIRMRGYYDDGTRFETGEFPITVRVCRGCLTAAAGEICPTAFTCPPDSNGQLPITCPE